MTSKMIEHATAHAHFRGLLSVELEKPFNKDIDMLLNTHAHVIFLSKTYALHHLPQLPGTDGDIQQHPSSSLDRYAHFLKEFHKTKAPHCALLVLAVGAEGALCSLKQGGEVARWSVHPVPTAKIVDSSGAGDSFLASMIFSIASFCNTTSDSNQSLAAITAHHAATFLQYSCAVAANKIQQVSFHGVLPLPSAKL